MRISFFWPWLTGVLVVVDQITKIAADRILTPNIENTWLPLINITLAYNPGAAFSFLDDAGGWQRWLFTGLSLGVSVFLIRWLIQLRDSQRWLSIALALILSGAIGNVIDRIFYGHVIDFIDFYYPTSSGCLPLFMKQGPTCHWPTFNVADSAISVGAMLMIALMLFGKYPEHENSESNAL